MIAEFITVIHSIHNRLRSLNM